MSTSSKKNPPGFVNLWAILDQYRRLPNGPTAETWISPTEMQRRRRVDRSIPDHAVPQTSRETSAVR